MVSASSLFKNLISKACVNILSSNISILEFPKPINLEFVVSNKLTLLSIIKVFVSIVFFSNLTSKLPGFVTFFVKLITDFFVPVLLISLFITIVVGFTELFEKLN